MSAINRAFPDNITIGVAPIVFAVFGLFTVIAGYRFRLRPSYIVYMLLNWMLAVSTAWWISIPRYVMAMFPMFILLGVLSRRKIVTVAVTLVFSAALCFFTVLFALRLWAF